jgi:hypothetical protein
MFILLFFYSPMKKSLLEYYMWLSSSKAIFQGTEKKQFSDFFLEMNECLKYVQIHVIHTFYTQFLTGIVPKTTQNMQLNKLIL